MKSFYGYIILLLAVACYPKSLPKSAYKSDTPKKLTISSYIQPDILIYHHEESNSKVFFHINTSQLLYAKSAETDDFYCRLHIHWKIYKTLEMKAALDTGSVMISEKGLQGVNKHLYASFTIPLASGSNYYIKFTVIDLNKYTQESKVCFTSKLNKSMQNFFYARNFYDSTVCFNHALNDYHIHLYSALNKASKLYIRAYKKIFPLPPPTFSNAPMPQFKYQHDTLIELYTDDNGYANIHLPPYNFFQFQTDTTVRTGMTLFNFAKGFPAVTSEQMLLEPLRYMCSSAEYEKLKTAQDIKSAVDNFWIARCGSKERARELIKTYYTRVEQANRKFTSYTEGWKTDRGMIWIIFGEPAVIETKENYISWLYKDRSNNFSLRYNFIKINNPFTDNDYWLERNISYKLVWYDAIETWRQGRVYSYGR
jgi:GWxTD domain-containing protein